MSSSSSSSSSFFILATLFHDALAQNYGYQGYGAPAPSLIPVTPSIYASDVASDSLSSSFPFSSGSATVDITPSSNTVNAIEATSSALSELYTETASIIYQPSSTPVYGGGAYTGLANSASGTISISSNGTSIFPTANATSTTSTSLVNALNNTDSHPSPTSETSYADYNITAIYASATKYLTTDDVSSSVSSIASANTISAYSDFNITAIIASATRYWNTTDSSSVAVAPTGYASSSAYIPPVPQSSTSISSWAYDTSLSSPNSQASSVESSRPYGAFLPFPMSGTGYYPTTSKYIPTATSLASFGSVPASLIMPTNSANASTTTNYSSTSTPSEPAYVIPSVVTSSAPPLDYAGETITSSFGGPPFTNSTQSTQYSAARATASAFNVTAIYASASAYLNSTFSEPSYVVPSIETSSAPPLDYAGEPLTSTVGAYNSTSLSEPTYVVPSVITSSAPPLDFAGEPITSSSASTYGGIPYGNVTSIYAQPTASPYNITAIIASATAYWNTTNVSTGLPTSISSLAGGVGTSVLGSGYSSIAVPLSSPAAPYGFPNSSIATPTAVNSLGSAVTLTTSSSATSTINAPVTLTVIPVAANTSLAVPISSDVPAAISSALSQITANASAALPTNITAGLSSAIAQITSLAGYGTSSTLAGPETFNASNTLPPESILAGISSAVAQITSLAGLTSAASESDDFESATPPSAQSTVNAVNAVNASAASAGQELVSTMAAASATGLAYTSESLSSAATSASVLVVSSAPAYGYGSLPSTLITQTVTATTQVSAQASADQTSSAQGSTRHKDSWLAELLSWAAGVVKDAFEKGKN